jgi:YVTN family beta-propeller protein
MRLEKRVRTGPQPKSVTLSPDGTELWVCNFGILDRKNVTVFDAETMDEKAEITFPGNAVETLFSRDMSTVWVSNFKQSSIFEIDPETYEIRREMPAGNHPKVMVESWDRKTLYAANWSSNDISVIDLASGAERHRHRTGEHPRGMALRRDGTLFVAAMFAHEIHVFPQPDAKDGGAEARTFRACHYPRHLALAPGEERLYATCSGNDSIQWFDPDDGRRRGVQRVGDNPRTLALSRDGRWAAVANFRGNTVSVVDLVGGKHRIHPLDGADEIVGVALDGRAAETGPRVWATSWRTRELIALVPR